MDGEGCLVKFQQVAGKDNIFRKKNFVGLKVNDILPIQFK